MFRSRMPRIAIVLVGSCCAFIAGMVGPARAADAGARAEESGYVATDDGVRLHFTRLGAGREVVVVPNEVYMLDDFKTLAVDRTVIFYDLRNRGRSDTVVDRDKLRGGIHREVDDLEAVRKHFALDRFAIVAHSYPSIIAALYAMKHPARVERVVQIGPPPADMKKPIPEQWRYADATSASVFEQLGKLQGGADADPIDLCRRSWAILRPLYVGRPEHASRLAQWGFCELRNEREMRTHWSQNIQPSLEALAISADDYAQARMPVLVIHGTHDRNAPYGGGREWVRSLPNARLITVEGAAHVPYVEDQKLVFGAIDTFLDGDWPAEAQAIQ